MGSRRQFLGAVGGFLPLGGVLGIEWLWGWISPKRNPPSVILTWKPSTSPDVAGYRIYRSEGSQEAASVKVAEVPGNVATWTDWKTKRGKLYFYRATAFNSAGESIPSNVALATVPQYPE